MKLKSTISNTFLVSMLIILVLTGGAIGFGWIRSENLSFENNLNKLKDDYLKQQKRIIKSQVENAIDYMTFREQQEIKAVTEGLKSNTLQAYNRIAYTYKSLQATTAKKVIVAEIIKMFRKQEVNDSTRFSFIQELGGKVLLNQLYPSTEGRNIYDYRDANGQYVIRSMEKLAVKKGESKFIHAVKRRNGQIAEVISYLKYFEPLDIYFISASFLDRSFAKTKQETSSWLANIHFNNSGYIYLLDYKAEFVMHPYENKESESFRKWQADHPHLLQQIVDSARKDEGGYLTYEYQKPGGKNAFPKLIFAKSYPEWKWVVVAGIYSDEIEKEIAHLQTKFRKQNKQRINNVLFLVVSLLVLAIFIAIVLSYILRKNLYVFTEFFTQAFAEGKKINPAELSFREFGLLAKQANQMIEQHKASQTALRKSESRFTEAIENLPIPTVICTLDYVPLYANVAFSDRFGYDLTDLSSQKEWLRQAFPDENYRKLVVQTWSTTVKESIKRHRPVGKQEWRFVRKDGDERDIRLRVVPIGSQALITVEDISQSKRSEAKLMDTLAQLNAILENSPSQIASIQRDGKVLYVNKPLKGLSLNKLKGANFFDFYPTSIQRILRPAFQKVYSTEKTHRFDFQDTNNNWWESLLIPVKSSTNKIEYVIAISNDITVRKWAEKALQEREERFKELSDATFEGILILKDSEIIEVNSIASKIFDYPASELVGQSILKVLDIEDKTRQEIEEKKDSNDSTDVIGHKKDGTKIHCELRTKFSSYNGQKVNVTAIRDVTARVEAQEALSHTEALLETANQRSPIGIMIADTFSSKIRMANDAAAEIFGMHSGDELLGYNYLDPTTEWRFLHYDGKEMQLEDTPLYRSVKGEVIKNMKAIVRRPDGSYRWLLINAAPIRNAQGFVSAAVMTFPDITELKQTEQRLIEAKEKAEEADTLKSAFLANMSHEIRTPMNAIIGFSDMIMDDETTEDERFQYIQYIIENGKSLLNLIEDIIDISKIEARQIDISKEECQLTAFFKELEAIFTAELNRLDKGHISLALEAEDPRHAKSFSTDCNRLKQVFINLLSNAVKFTDSGTISFGYRVMSQRLYFFVKDTGIGIPKEKQVEIFNRFTKISSTRNRLYGGTGLGLAISRRLVELLGGEIGLNSEIGKGSLFYFSLPFSESVQHESSVKTILQNSTKIDISNKTILVAEDEEANFKLIKAVFKKENVTLIRAKNGYEVINYLEKNDEVDIILLDIKMPVMDGYETIRILKERFESIPVIAQTALAMANDRVKILEAGFNDYISKPLKKQQLLEKISSYI